MPSIDNYIGAPWKIHGRTPAGIDCYGLLIVYYRLVLNIELPDFIYDDVNEKQRLIALHRTNWIQVKEPEEHCAVLMTRRDEPWHIGIYLVGDKILHARRDIGVVIEPIANCRKMSSYYVHG